MPKKMIEFTHVIKRIFAWLLINTCIIAVMCNILTFSLPVFSVSSIIGGFNVLPLSLLLCGFILCHNVNFQFTMFKWAISSWIVKIAQVISIPFFSHWLSGLIPSLLEPALFGVNDNKHKSLIVLNLTLTLGSFCFLHGKFSDSTHLMLPPVPVHLFQYFRTLVIYSTNESFFLAGLIWITCRMSCDFMTPILNCVDIPDWTGMYLPLQADAFTAMKGLKDIQTFYKNFLISVLIYALLRILNSSFQTILLYPVDFSKIKSMGKSPIRAALSEGGASPSARKRDKMEFPWLEHYNSSTLGGLGYSYSGIKPYWQTVQDMQFRHMEDIINEIVPSIIGAPKVPFLTTEVNDVYAGLIAYNRLLAFQDFARLSRTSYLRRQQIFHHDFPFIAYSSCLFLDAVTFQLQLYTAYGVHDVLDALHVETLAKDHRAVDPREFPTYLPSVSQPRTSPSSMSVAVEIVKAGKRIRKELLQWTVESIVGRCASWILSQPFLRYVPFLNPLARWACGVHEVSVDPLPAGLTQAAQYAAEGLSLSLIAAAVEDAAGPSQHYIPAVLRSLMALEVALEEYNDVYRRYNALFPSRENPHWLNFDLKRGGSKVKGLVVSGDLLALKLCLSEALDGLLRTYRHKLPSYSFPISCIRRLEGKLSALS